MPAHKSVENYTEANHEGDNGGDPGRTCAKTAIRDRDGGDDECLKSAEWLAGCPYSAVLRRFDLLRASLRVVVATVYGCHA